MNKGLFGKVISSLQNFAGKAFDKILSIGDDGTEPNPKSLETLWGDVYRNIKDEKMKELLLIVYIWILWKSLAAERRSVVVNRAADKLLMNAYDDYLAAKASNQNRESE